ncbi:MAG: sugar ABC transporter ATP-binding protein [Candidatus Atribacteria bacterium]|nr:sugar ABC transporter ATP-binding protein [Candidatus Atribacteria bacterium]
MDQDRYILRLKGISKFFPGLKALDQVDFDLRYGEIHALVGENGAGKSTLIKIITGVYQPDEGEIIYEDQRVIFSNPMVANRYQIAAVYQQPASFPHLTVTENIFLGHPLIQPQIRRLLWKEMYQQAKALLSSLGAEVSPTAVMGSLSVAQQQMVEIAKALSINAKILIMDEPTAALTKRETEDLYAITRKLRDQGTSVIFISHRFEDIYEIGERVTVLRDGKSVGTWKVNDITEKELIKALVGREITQMFPKNKVAIKNEILKVEGLSRIGYFSDVSFSLRAGEILGFSGLVGSGRTEIAQAIFGIAPADRGKILIEGQEVTIRNPMDAISHGIGYLPEDRLRQGLFLPMSINDNITITIVDQLSRGGWLNPPKEKEISTKMLNLLKIKAPDVSHLVSSLSGGNQQKVVVAKLLAARLKILIMDEPTQGVDVGAKAAIHQIMSDLAAEGFGIIMISSEMPEVLGMSDTILVMHEGRVNRIFYRDEANQEKLMEAAVNVDRSFWKKEINTVLKEHE